MNIPGLVDDRNRELWNILSNEYDINVVRVHGKTYSVHTNRRLVTITIPLDKADSASFTHELLHVLMKKMGIYVGGNLQLYVNQNPVLAKFILEGLTDHIGNCLEHIKMFPEFIKMGYNRKDFIYDYETNKLTEEEIERMKQGFKKRTLLGKMRYNSKTVTLFIAKFFAAKACPNLTYDYNKTLRELAILDHELFSSLDTFMIGWNSYNYNDSQLETGGYDDILSDLTTSLGDWGREKSFV